MVLWVSAAAHASHKHQLLCAKDLAEVPHIVLRIQCNPNASEHAVQDRHSWGSFAPWETLSISGCNYQLLTCHAAQGMCSFMSSLPRLQRQQSQQTMFVSLKLHSHPPLGEQGPKKAVMDWIVMDTDT